MKELYKKCEVLNEEMYALLRIIDPLRTLIDKYGEHFKNSSSIVALENIKKYLLEKENELKIKKEEIKSLESEIKKNCNHEVVVRRSNCNSYYCLVCDCYMRDDSIKRLPLLIDVSGDYNGSLKVYEAFRKAINSDMKIIDYMTLELEDIQYEHKIKVIRRVR